MSEILTAPFLIQLAMLAATAGSIYGAIRGDLKSLRRDIDRNSRAIGHAHGRMDRHIEKQH